MISIEDVRAAARRLEGIAHRTPVFTSRTLGEHVVLKAESLQRTGAFKFRGAYNAISQLDGARGVAAVSSGNHAQAVAHAAQLLGLPATIIMPTDAPASKRAATEAYGAEVVEYDRYSQHRETLLDDLAADRGLVAIHPFDNDHVMAGQGTVALELLEQAPGLEQLLVPVGGGGLISGCSTAAPGLRVVGVEPEAGDDVRRSLAAGEVVTIDVPRTIADGQQTPAPSERTFAVIRERVDEVVTVTDEEIVAAMRFAFERLKLVLEPSGATALAVALREPPGRPTGVVLSGGNVDADRFASLI